MANSVSIQILEDGPRNLIIKLVGIVDTANVAAADLFDPAARSKIGLIEGLATRFALECVEFSVSAGISLVLYEDATADVPLLTMQQSGEFEFNPPLINTEASGVTGKIQYATVDYASGSQTYTATLHFRKYQK
jgi:hypothetical protein